MAWDDSDWACTLRSLAAADANVPRYDAGTIANGVYTNDCMGFSIAVPSGWNLQKEPGNTDTTVIGTHMPDGSISLLSINRPPDPSPGGGIVMIAQDASRFNGTAQDFVRRAVQSFADKDPARREVLQNGTPVSYGGKQFYRSDYKQSLTNGGEIYLSYVFTTFREHLLGAIVSARSADALALAIDPLQHISFAADQTNPACIVGDNKLTGHMVGILGTVDRGTGGKPLRVRVPSTVANGLLINKVDPQYPDEARKAGVQGPVVLKIDISKEGDVEGNITLVSGDPKILLAALDAVKKWKFKPYKLNGEPVEIETTVTVNFEPLP